MLRAVWSCFEQAFVCLSGNSYNNNNHRKDIINVLPKLSLIPVTRLTEADRNSGGHIVREGQI